jgi:predicted ATPase
LEELEFRKSVTFIIGENGSGKSTLVEALAINAGFNPEGGSRNFNFRTQDSHSKLYHDIKLTRSPYRNTDGFFLRAESFYNVASEIDNILDKGQIKRNYGGSLHERSHGESFLALVHNRLSGNGLYIFDEPESALSITSQLNLLIVIKELVEKESQFIIATHSPILMAYPEADIYHVSVNGLELINYEDTEQYRLTKYFINNYRKMIDELGFELQK